MYLSSCNIQEKSYVRTVPSRNLLRIIQRAFEIMNISYINYFCIKFIPGFYASIRETVFFHVSLACCPFQFILVSSYCAVVPHKQIITQLFPDLFYALYTINSPLSLSFSKVSAFSLESLSS